MEKGSAHWRAWKGGEPWKPLPYMAEKIEKPGRFSGSPTRQRGEQVNADARPLAAVRAGGRQPDADIWQRLHKEAGRTAAGHKRVKLGTRWTTTDSKEYQEAQLKELFTRGADGWDPGEKNTHTGGYHLVGSTFGRKHRVPGIRDVTKNRAYAVAQQRNKQKGEGDKDKVKEERWKKLASDQYGGRPSRATAYGREQRRLAADEIRIEQEWKKAADGWDRDSTNAAARMWCLAGSTFGDKAVRHDAQTNNACTGPTCGTRARAEPKEAVAPAHAPSQRRLWRPRTRRRRLLLPLSSTVWAQLGNERAARQLGREREQDDPAEREASV
eukprot:gene16555-17189_t